MSTPLNGDQVVATLPYRNTFGGMQLDQMPNIFFTSVALQAGKTIQSVTLPRRVNQSEIHIFAIGRIGRTDGDRSLVPSRTP